MTGRSVRTDSWRSWLIVACSFASLFGVWGTVFTFTVYADALAATFGLTTVQTSSLFSVGVAVTFVAGGFAGLFAARLSVRAVMATAAIAMAVGSWSFTVVSIYPMAIVGFAMVGAATGTVFVLVLSLVPQWFDEYEGRAMGLTVIGSGLSVQVMPFVWLWLLDRTSFRTAFVLVGTGVAFVLGLAVIIITRPKPRGSEQLVDWAWLSAFARRRDVHFAFVGLIFLWAWYFVLSGNAVGILAAKGVPRGIAAGAFGLVGGVSIASRPMSGVLGDRYGYRTVIFGALTMTSVGILLLQFAGSRPVLFLSMAAFGLGLGAIAALYPSALIQGIDPAHPTAVVGSFQFANAVAGLMAPLGISVLVELTDGYTIPLLVLAAMTMIGAVLFWLGTDPTSRTVSQGVFTS